MQEIGGGCPFDGFGNARPLDEGQIAQGLDRIHRRMRRRLGDMRRPQHDDARFRLAIGIIDPVIDAAPAQGFVEIAGAVGGQDHDRRRLGLDRAALGDRNLEVGEEFEQQRFEFMIGAVDLVDQQHALLRRAQG